MKPEHDGNLSIRGDVVEIEIVDESSGCIAATIYVEPVEFLLAIARRGNVPCRFWLNKSGVVGARREVKTELVPFDAYKSKHATDVYRTPKAIEALAAFETDGWQGEARDLWNGHCREKVGEQAHQRVRFVRFIKGTEKTDA